ncbi:hypothetical protein [Nonlabens dokdonensis]|uniref:hypothetical protein n=1 Tax=Nonlabens dokdonensis TaxID=328515 RepID=UPI0026EB1E88|nr:hypothetical protein [Nonlabens dokdonensis]
MTISERLSSYSTICGIAIDATAVAAPSVLDSQNRFYDTKITDGTRQPSYFGKSSVRFRENKKESNAGRYFEQTCTIQFPNNDKNAIERIKKYEDAKFVYIKNSSGKELLLGRNDHKQNRKPFCDVQRDVHMTVITFSTQSIFPTGFLATDIPQGLPHIFPIFLFN